MCTKNTQPIIHTLALCCTLVATMTTSFAAEKRTPEFELFLATIEENPDHKPKAVNALVRNDPSIANKDINGFRLAIESLRPNPQQTLQEIYSWHDLYEWAAENAFNKGNLPTAEQEKVALILLQSFYLHCESIQSLQSWKAANKHEQKRTMDSILDISQQLLVWNDATRDMVEQKKRGLQKEHRKVIASFRKEGDPWGLNYVPNTAEEHEKMNAYEIKVNNFNTGHTRIRNIESSAQSAATIGIGQALIWYDNVFPTRMKAVIRKLKEDVDDTFISRALKRAEFLQKD